MPLIESAPDALAEIYARSLFDLVNSKGGRAQVEEIGGELEEVLELARSDAQFNEFLGSLALAMKERAKSLDRIFKGRISPLTLQFLQVLNQKGRLSHLPSIVAAYDALVQKQFGRVEVDVYTAAPISTEERRTLQARLSAKIGREAIVHPYTDDTMIGGVKFRIGDQLIDASLATQLRQFRDRLATEGTAELRARAERIIEDKPGAL
jgi:F-type H+-transporting ATPase subunit delta